MKTLAWLLRNSTLLAKESAETESRRRIVIVERSAESVEQVLENAEFHETIVVAESRGDAAPSLALRVAGRIAQLEQRGTPACSATLVLGQEHNRQAAAAREFVAHSLLSHLRATGGSELTILAPSPSDAERDEALGLVDRLLSELDTQSITIRLKFAAHRRSQTAAKGRPADARQLPTVS